MRLHAYIIFMFIILPNIKAQYRGIVFFDKNYNNKYDIGDESLDGCLVTNGFDIVKTDSEGFFQLDYNEKFRFVYLTLPSGFYAEKQFYREIDEHVDFYEFPLLKLEKSGVSNKKHKFVHLSDTEISNIEGNRYWVDGLKEFCSNNDISFIVHTGDICYENGLRAHIQLMNTANMEVPVYYTLGNHDLVKGEYGEKLYEDLYGPVYYSFEVGNVHYIVLPMLYGDYSTRFTTFDVYNWFINDLSSVELGHPIIIFCHDLLLDENKVLHFDDKYSVDLGSFNLKSWVYGHWHMNDVKDIKTTYCICTSSSYSGGIDHSLSAFRVFNIDNLSGELYTYLQYPFINKMLKINSLYNERISIINGNKLPIIVNAYNSSSSIKSINYRIINKRGHTLYSRKLNKKTNFTWSDECVLANDYLNMKLSLEITAKCSNDEVLTTMEEFIADRSSDNIKIGSDCSNFLYNSEHSGTNDSKIAPPLKLNWVKNLGQNIYMCMPLSEDGSIVIGTGNDDFISKGQIVCIDSKSGNVNWTYKTNGAVVNNMTISNGCVIAQDTKGYAYCIEVATGDMKWNKSLGWNVIPSLKEGVVSLEGTVYLGSGKCLYALNATTGDVMWRNNEWNMSQGCVTTLTTNGDILIGGAHWGSLYANDAKTGCLVWKNEEKGLKLRSSTPVIIKDTVYTLSDKSLYKINVNTGEILLRKELEYNVDVASTPLFLSDFIIFGTVGNGVVALDANTLEEKWTFKTGKSLIYSAPYSCSPDCTVEASPILSSNTIYISASDGCLYALDVRSGRMIWKHFSGSPRFSTVLVTGNTLYSTDFAGNVYCFSSIN